MDAVINDLVKMMVQLRLHWSQSHYQLDALLCSLKGTIKSEENNHKIFTYADKIQVFFFNQSCLHQINKKISIKEPT